MYTIIHKRKMKFVYSIRKELSISNPDRVKLSFNKAITFLTEADALFFMAVNQIHKNSYAPCKIAISVIDSKLKF